MRARGIIGLAIALALGTSVPAVGGEAEALRREMDEMHRRLQKVQQEYQDALRAMSERLRRMEAGARTAAAPSIVGQGLVGQTPPSPTADPTLMDLARPRAPFSLAERTGRGQLLFDIGVVGDFIANVTSGEVERENVGTFDGRENRVFPREVELSLFGQVDPYARAEVRLEAAEEFEDGER